MFKIRDEPIIGNFLSTADNWHVFDRSVLSGNLIGHISYEYMTSIILRACLGREVNKRFVYVLRCKTFKIRNDKISTSVLVCFMLK